MTDQSSSHAEYSSIPPLRFVMDQMSVALLQKIVRQAVELLALEDCVVALLDEQDANLVVVANSQEESLPAQSLSFPLQTSLAAAVVEKRQPEVLTHARQNALTQPLDEGATRALACLPLLDQEQVLGVLLASTSTAMAPANMRLLSLLAEQATLTLLNARQAALVRDANKMKANFLSLVTHELRSPLNTINGYLDLALEGLAGDLNEQQREFLQRARAGSEHLYALVEDLLLASRADAGQLRLSREPVVLRELVDAALEELELTARDAQVSLQATLPANLPTLVVDAVRVQQVLRNLLCNALHFTPAGGHVTVSARVLPAPAEGEQAAVEIRVTDTGCGIDPAYHERIFERFFQVPHLAGGRVTGQGLGLAIVKTIVELHGGRVCVESTPGAGSTFVFTLES